jgi:hypothetical protein
MIKYIVRKCLAEDVVNLMEYREKMVNCPLLPFLSMSGEEYCQFLVPSWIVRKKRPFLVNISTIVVKPVPVR